ncbi:MAG: STAS domain-containing protein [Methylococcaceae bacterium]|nr:STAS domain-containing protein [Methylococcaceae bacterium]
MTINTELDSASKTLEINISGRFDFDLHQDFRKATDEVGSGVNSIIINMLKVDYLDSSALGMLLILKDKMGNAKDAVKIKNMKGEVKKILEIANFDKIFVLE